MIRAVWDEGFKRSYRKTYAFNGADQLTKEYSMDKSIQIEVKPEDIIEAVKKMKKRERDAFLEDLLAATSPDYVSGIKEARADYKAGRTKTHEEVFGE